MRRVVIAVTGWLTLASPIVLASEQVELARVRPLDPIAEFLMDEGQMRSVTFARLLSALERSDVVVYVDVASESALGPSGFLSFGGAGGGNRYLRVRINTGTPSWSLGLARHQELIAILGHELR